MKKITKYGKYVLLFLVSLLYASCSHDVVGPVSGTSGKLKIDLSNAQNGVKNTKLADMLLRKPDALAKTKNVLNVTDIDEVKLLVLDMTKWSSWEEFLANWQNTNQYGLLDTAIENRMKEEGKDEWDIYSTVFKSYKGTAYSYSGDYGFLIDGGKANGTIYLNPGINYFFYTFRSLGRTLSVGEETIDIKESEENLIQLGSKDATGAYSGLWNSNTGADTVSGALSMTLTQSADSIKGTVSIGGSSCYSSFTISSGSISGSSVYVYAVSGNYYMNMIGTLSGNNLAGSWSVYPTCGNVSNGTFTVTRAPR